MDVLRWGAEHPWLFVFVVLVSGATICSVARAVMQASIFLLAAVTKQPVRKEDVL